MGVGVCPDIAFFLIPFGRVDYYSYLCTVLKYILIGGGLIRENGVATFHKCTLKVGKMHLCWVFCWVFLKIEKG